MGRHHIEQLTVDCAPPASAAAETRVVHLHTSLIDHHHLQREVGMIDEGRNADEFIEEIVESATLRRAPIGHAFPGQGDASSDRVNHQYLMVRKQAVEFGTHGTKRACLNLDDAFARPDVDHEAFELELFFRSALGVARLQRRVQRSLVQRPYGSDWSESTGPLRGVRGWLVL